MRTIIFLLCLCFSTLAFAEDRVTVQVMFKKGIFECPDGDEIVDWNVGGGNEYEHTCKDGTWLNRFKEYNGTVSYPVGATLTKDSITNMKKDKVAEWLYGVRNPPIYIEPSVKDLENLRADKLEEAQRYEEQLLIKAPEKAVAIKAELEAKVAVMSEAIVVKPIEKVTK